MGNENVLVRMLNNLYSIANAFILIATIGMVFWVFPKLFIAKRQAKSDIEHLYWNANIVSVGAIIYGFLLFLAMCFADADTSKSIFIKWWPSFSWLFTESSFTKADYLGFDSMICFFGGFVMWLCTGIFGSFDDMGYEEPRWYRGRKDLKDIHDQYAALKLEDPRQKSNFQTLSTVDQVNAVHQWEKDLADLEKSYKKLKWVYS